MSDPVPEMALIPFNDCLEGKKKLPAAASRITAEFSAILLNRM